MWLRWHLLHQPINSPEENYSCFLYIWRVCYVDKRHFKWKQQDQMSHVGINVRETWNVKKAKSVIIWSRRGTQTTAHQRPENKIWIWFFPPSLFCFVPFYIHGAMPLFLWLQLLFVGKLVAINYSILWLQFQDKIKTVLKRHRFKAKVQSKKCPHELRWRKEKKDYIS